MLKPIHLQNETLIVQSFGANDLQQWPSMVEGMYALLTDKQALKYLPFRRLDSYSDADALLKNALISLHCGRNYLHFIRKRTDGQIIGFVDIISPGLAREHYRLQKYPHFIEFCIKTEYSRNKLMSNLLPDFLASLQRQRIEDIAAVINGNNIAAQKLLSRSGFSYHRIFDDSQDIYQFSPEQVNVA